MNVINLFALIGITVSIGFIANFFFKKTKIPDILWLLCLGLLIGPIFNLISPSYFMNFMPFLSALALLTILFDAGLNMNIYKVLREVPRGLLIALLGFSLSMITVSIASVYIFSFGLLKGILLGAIVGGVSSAVVIPVVSGLHLREESTLILDLESVITDSLCIILSLIFIGMIATESATGFVGAYEAVRGIISSFSISIVIGFGLGLIWLSLLDWIEKREYYYILTLGFLFLAYSLVESLEGSGAVASLMIGLALGNGKQIGNMLKLKEITSGLERRARAFQSQIAFFVKSFFFVALGVLISLKEINLFLYGGLLGILLLVVRWIAVKISTFKLKLSKREEDIMTFMMPRGLATAVMATIPFVEYGISGTQSFIDITFSVIIFTSVISTLGIFWVESRGKKD